MYVLGLHFFVAILILRTDFLPRFKAAFLSVPASENLHGKRMAAFHTAMDASVPAGAAIFLGDSITQGLATAAVAPSSVNYGIGSATSSELLGNLPKYQSLRRASVVFLMIGINDIRQGKAEGLVRRLSEIAVTLPSELPLIWSGIMPAYSEKIDPALIASTNLAIQELCAARRKCVYVNTERLFSDHGAELLRDGVHPNDRGYTIWITQLRKSYEEVLR